MEIDSDFRLQGYCDTGDRFMNKMIYHFRTPDRGEVFVLIPKELRDQWRYPISIILNALWSSG